MCRAGQKKLQTGRDESGNLGKTVRPQIKASFNSSGLPTLPETEIGRPKAVIMIAPGLLEENYCKSQRWQWEPQLSDCPVQQWALSGERMAIWLFKGDAKRPMMWLWCICYANGPLMLSCHQEDWKAFLPPPGHHSLKASAIRARWCRLSPAF